MRLGFKLISQDSNVVLLTLDTDNIECKYKIAGSHRVRAQLPRNFLNVGKYFLTVGADIPNKKINFSEESCVGFSVEQDSIIGGEHGIGRIGIVRPLLVWRRLS